MSTIDTTAGQDVTVRYVLVEAHFPADTDPDERTLTDAALTLADDPDLNLVAVIATQVYPGDTVAPDDEPDTDATPYPGYATDDPRYDEAAQQERERHSAARLHPMTDVPDLIAEYDTWRDERADLSATEEPSSSAWADSDDTGCDLASRLADALRSTAGVAATLHAALNVALNAPGDSAAMEGARAALDGLTPSDLAATADARYAALTGVIRDEWIDTARTLLGRTDERDEQVIDALLAATATDRPANASQGAQA